MTGSNEALLLKLVGLTTLASRRANRGKPDRSSGNTAGKSRTTRMSIQASFHRLIHASDPGSFSGLSPCTSRNPSFGRDGIRTIFS
ncbi:hypothetical protein Tco_1405730 [Tanacetum coccineum]